jgi:acetolactate synthase-1/2/3 large subunit
MMQTFDRDNLVITHDSGNPREQLTAFWEATVPRSYLGWGYTTNLGFSWGAMMGAKLAFPDRLCVNFVGDAAVGHQLMDMETSLREGLPILTVVSNNSGYAVYGARGRSIYPDIIAKKFVSPSSIVSYARVAEGLGCYGERVEEPDEVIPALRRGVKEVHSGRPALIEVITSFETERVGFSPPSGYEPGKP